MRRILTVVFGLLLIVVLAVAGLFFAVPDGFIEGRAESMAGEALGRELAIDGDFTVRRWPPIAVAAENIRLANADWGEDGDMLRIRRLELELDGWALLSGRVVLKRFLLEAPDLLLERDAEGRANWEFEGMAAATAHEPAAARDGDEERGAPGFVELREIRVTEGRVRYRDGSTGETRTAEDITLAVLEERAARSLSVEGSLDLDGAPLRLTAEIVDPRALAAGGRGEMKARFELPEGAVAFAGRIDGTTPELAGTLDLAFTDLRGALARFGIAPELTEEVLGELVLTGTLNASPRALALQELELALDDITARGRIGVLGLDARPRVVAELAFGALALDPYLPPAGEASEPEEEKTAGTGADGWPDDPLELPLPLPFDAELDLRFESLAARGIALDGGRLRATMEGDSAALEVVELAAYGGRIALEAQLTAGTPHRIALEGRTDGLQMLPLLTAVAGFDRLEGRGDAEFAITASGGSVKELVGALDGQGRIVMRDGAIVGVNIAAMVRQVMTLGQEGGGEPPVTDFAELGGSFTITEGIVENRDLLLKAPLLRLDGEGTVDLPARRLDYRIRPALAATLEGQAASREPVFKAGVPIVLTGPWEAIEWRFDIGGTLTEAITDPAGIGELVGDLRADPEILGKLGRDFGGAVEGVTGFVGGVLGEGGGGEAETAPPAAGDVAPDTPLAPARKLFEGILGR